MTNKSVETTVKKLMLQNKSFKEISESLNISLREVEEIGFQLCIDNPDKLPIDSFLTKEWLEEKIKTCSIIEIANITHQKFRRIQYLLLTKYKITARREPTTILPNKDTLTEMYVTQRMSDGKIAKEYNVSVHTIKNLRYRLGIFKTDRILIEDVLTREFFYRLHVELGISVLKIAEILNTNRKVVTTLKDEYAKPDDEISKAIINQTNKKQYNTLLERLIEKLPRKELIDKLHTESILEIAAEYGLIDSNNKLVPFTKEWFLLELQEKSPSRISIETKKPYREICDMLDNLGIDRSKRHDEIDPDMLRYLFEELFWSDSEIAEMFGIAKFAISQQRYSLGITAQSRLSLEERLPVQLFLKLYLEEKLNTVQLSKIFKTGVINISNLKHKYIDNGYKELCNTRSTGVSKERFDYLQRQIDLGLYKI